jgi:RimJ/RimL family protein N-acetyltransferase
VAKPLQTSRLHLRPLVDADQEFYCRLYTDPAVMARVGTPLSREAAQGAFGRVLRQIAAKPPRSHYWMLCERGTQAVIGLMALVFDRDDRTSAEVGVLLLSNSQGQGHATEAIAVLADRIFAETELTRLWTRHAPCHAAAIGLMCSLGFTPGAAEGDHPAAVCWQLLRGDWRIAAPPFAKQAPNR